MTQITEDSPQQDNIVAGVLFALVLLAILITATVVTLRDHPNFSLDFGTGSSCYTVAHQAVCK